MHHFIKLFVFVNFLVTFAYASTNQVALLDPVQEQMIHTSRTVLQFGVFNKSKQSQRLTAHLDTLSPGDSIGFYTNDKIINQKLFDQFKVRKSRVRISPKKISVASKQMRPFRVAINLKGALPGTYFGNLLVKQLSVKSNIIHDNKNDKSKDFSVKLSILFDQYAAFYLNKGDGNPFNPVKGQTPVKIECAIDKENKNLTLHVHNDTSYALRSKVMSIELSDKVYRLITVLPYTKATRDITVPIINKLKLPLKLEFLIKNKKVSSVMCA